MDALVKLSDDIRAEFPDFLLKRKENSRFMKLLDLLLKLITFGQMTKFMVSFTTTIGNTIYVPSTWPVRPPKSKMIILRHERIHMRQRRRLGLWYSISYLLFPLPAVWAWCRMKYEMEAYEESIRAMYEYYGTSAFTDRTREVFLGHFTGAEYFWTWPWRKRIERWYDATLARVIAASKA